MSFWYGFFFCFSLLILGFVGCAVFNFIEVYPFPLKSRVYVIGPGDIIYDCYFLGGGVDVDDGNFYFHFYSCDGSETGWTLLRAEIRTEVFASHRRAEKALEKRRKGND